jgi:hypothetical protein
MLRIIVDFNSRSLDGNRVPICKYLRVNFQELYAGRRFIECEPGDIGVEATLVQSPSSQ